MSVSAPDSVCSAQVSYSSQLNQLQEQLAQLEARDARFGSLRVATFFGFVVGLGFALSTNHPFWIGATVIGLIAFLVVIIRNEVVRDTRGAVRNQTLTLRRLQARLDRDWQQLAQERGAIDREAWDLSNRQRYLDEDLDLLGDASLMSLVSMTSTGPGNQTLAHWLTQSVRPEVAQARHEAVKFLAPQRERRLRFYSLARDVGRSTGNPAAFQAWATQPNWLPDHGYLKVWANLSVVLSVVLVLMAIVCGLLGHAAELRITLFALVLLAVGNFLLASFTMGPVAEIFSIAMATRRSVSEYAELFAAADWLPQAEGDTDANQVIAHIRSHLFGDESAQEGLEVRHAVHAMDELASIAKAGALKQSAATFLFYVPLQAFGLWDLRVLRRLEDWKSRYRDAVPNWFDALGQFEALLSIAALRDEYPDWASPTWQTDSDDGEPTLICESLGHPLLADHQRVCNDVTIGPPGRFLLVTGSNMSGKSTMLRSVGLNVALAMAGGPVCCRSMRLPAVEMASSIRVSDDVSQGVSFYMAELQRLAGVVQHARELSDSQVQSGQPRLLFLLDEILQGTNSRERQIAVTRVLRLLVECGAIGAITTHDLELADEPELMRIADTVHFRETISPDADGNERMTFDYQMHPGVSPTTNALRLLEMVGINDESSGG